MKKILLFALVALSAIAIQAQEKPSTAIDSIEKTLHYKTGKIKFTDGNGVITVPKGFKFLEAKEAQYVLRDLWGNPEDLSLLGAIVPENKGVTSDDSWLFTRLKNSFSETKIRKQRVR